MVDVLKARFGRSELIGQLMDQGFDLACCSVHITEVYSGLRAGEEAKTAKFLNSLVCLPVTAEIAAQAACSREIGKDGDIRCPIPTSPLLPLRLATQPLS